MLNGFCVRQTLEKSKVKIIERVNLEGRLEKKNCKNFNFKAKLGLVLEFVRTNEFHRGSTRSKLLKLGSVRTLWMFLLMPIVNLSRPLRFLKSRSILMRSITISKVFEASWPIYHARWFLLEFYFRLIILIRPFEFS